MPGPGGSPGRLRDALVTYLPRAGVSRPMVIDGRTILEPGSPVVWFTFPGAWHDIGRFHTADGRFTGWYANILTPVEISGDDWRTTDLFLDVLLEPARPPRVLDRDELQAALDAGWIDAATAARAEAESDRLVELARGGRWPPPVVAEWTLEKARRHSDGPQGVSGTVAEPESEDS